jgi:hypothetical protein
MEFRILGPLEVLEDGRPVALVRLKERNVLALWGESPLLASARERASAGKLEAAVELLRRILALWQSRRATRARRSTARRAGGEGPRAVQLASRGTGAAARLGGGPSTATARAGSRDSR